jgi:hypothetical protein
MTVHRFNGEVIVAFEVEMVFERVAGLSDEQIIESGEAFLDRMIGMVDDETGVRCDNVIFEVIKEDQG